jgi:hypothetical protein
MHVENLPLEAGSAAIDSRKPGSTIAFVRKSRQLGFVSEHI